MSKKVDTHDKDLEQLLEAIEKGDLNSQKLAIEDLEKTAKILLEHSRDLNKATVTKTIEIINEQSDFTDVQIAEIKKILAQLVKEKYNL